MVAIANQPRLAQPKDLEPYLGLVREHALEVGARPRAVLTIHRQLFDLYVHHNDGVILIVDQVGCLAWGRPPEDVMGVLPTAQGYGVYVRPAYRGQGIATMMIREAVRVLRERGFRHIAVTPGIENDPAIGMLESVGFEKKQVIMVKRI